MTKVAVRGGDGYDLLVSAVAVADPDWRSVLAHGPAVWSAVRGSGGGELTRAAARFGRFGWINLIGLLATSGGKGDRAALLDLLTRTPPDRLRFVAAGGERQQLRERIDVDRFQAALDGDAAANRELNRALASPGMLPEVSPWIRRVSDEGLKDTLLGVAQAWPDLPVEHRPNTTSARLRAVGPAALLAEVTPGIRYGPDVLERVVLVGSVLVEPILISVDQSDATVIVHPPLGAEGMADAASSLREQGNAVGDETRILVLHELRAGPRTLAELCARLDRPRTTLLHHLALLRAAGFVTLSVAAGEPNVYRIDPAGFERLARAARGFVLE